MLCLPNSCFRSGNSLGRVSMIDGCLRHIISKVFIISHGYGYHVLRAASSGALRSWDPGGSQVEVEIHIYTSLPLQDSSIFTFRPPVSLHPPQMDKHISKAIKLFQHKLLPTVINLAYLHLFINCTA